MQQPVESSIRFGRYLLVEKLGQGGFAEVWRALVPGQADNVVIKILLPERMRSVQARELFVQEARLYKHLRHPNIVEVMEYGVHNGRYYMAMELVDGPSLHKVLARCFRAGMRIPTRLALHLVSEVAQALQYAHRVTDGSGESLQVVHLDVTPANVLVRRDGRVKLTDFGLARARLDDAATTEEAPGRGTPSYMAPEVILKRGADGRSDVFSLGVVLMELLTVTPLYARDEALETMRAVLHTDIAEVLPKHPEIDASLHPLLERALSRAPAGRFSSARVFSEQLAQQIEARGGAPSPSDVATFLRVLSKAAPSGATVRPPPNRRNGKHSPRYRLRAATGGHFGPLTQQNLRKLIQAHAVAPDEPVSVDGGVWRPLAALTELKSSVSKLLEDGGAATTAERGAIRPGGVVRQIVRLAASRAEVRLRLTGVSTRKELCLAGSRVVHVTSSDRRELLGEMLVELGFLDRQALDDVLRELGGRRRLLGQELLDRGLVEARTLDALLAAQLRQKLVTACEWVDGEYAVLKGRTDNWPSPPPPALVPAMLEGLRRSVTTEEVEEYLRALGPRPLRLSASAIEELKRMGLGSREEGRLRGLVTRPRTYRVITQQLGEAFREGHSMRLMLYFLHQVGYLTQTR